MQERRRERAKRAQPCLTGLRQSQDNKDKRLGHEPHPVRIDQGGGRQLPHMIRFSFLYEVAFKF